MNTDEIERRLTKVLQKNPSDDEIRDRILDVGIDPDYVEVKRERNHFSVIVGFEEGGVLGFGVDFS